MLEVETINTPDYQTKSQTKTEDSYGTLRYHIVSIKDFVALGLKPYPNAELKLLNKLDAINYYKERFGEVRIAVIDDRVSGLVKGLMLEQRLKGETMSNYKLLNNLIQTNFKYQGPNDDSIDVLKVLMHRYSDPKHPEKHTHPLADYTINSLAGLSSLLFNYKPHIMISDVDNCLVQDGHGLSTELNHSVGIYKYGNTLPIRFSFGLFGLSEVFWLITEKITHLNGLTGRTLYERSEDDLGGFIESMAILQEESKELIDGVKTAGMTFIFSTHGNDVQVDHMINQAKPKVNRIKVRTIP